jgi:hypothetical protein
VLTGFQKLWFVYVPSRKLVMRPLVLLACAV